MFAWMVSIALAAVAQADVVTFDLDNVWLLPDITRPWEPEQQMTGSFEWTYEERDFENGFGQFIELYTPWYNPGIENLNITVEPTSIEFSLIGNFHDLGLDLTMFLLDPLSANQPAAIDLVRSTFEIQQGVVFQGHFVSGSIVPTGIPEPSCDFSSDGGCEVGDLNALLAVGPVAPGVPASGNEQFDLVEDGVIDNADVDEWLTIAASENGFTSPYKRGDANLDGVVDASDFNIWYAGKFTSTLLWDHGNFDGDGVADVSDFNIWNTNKFTASDGVSMVPEPTTGTLWVSALVFLSVARMRR